MTPFNVQFSRFVFSRQFVSRTAKILAASLALAAPPALAAENWVACDGTVATSITKVGKTETTSAPARRQCEKPARWRQRRTRSALRS